jgi:transcriptional regulator with GAF, ATPase, and Fis domain
MNELSGDLAFGIMVLRARIERKRADEERLAHLRFFEIMDRVNLAIQGTNDLEQLMSDVLDAVLSIFDCDRAWLIYPCDPEASSWSVPMERTKPEYPGASVRGLEIPMDSEIQRVLRTVRDTDGPVPFGPGSVYPLPEWLREQFRVQSQLIMATYPKTGKPWAFGMHQCSCARAWTQEEQRLFQEINGRLADALTSLLAYRDLRELSEVLEQRVMKRTAELEDKNRELERFNRIFVGRELRMVELKERIRELENGGE